MAKEMETPKDEGLQGNETIEEAILGLQKEPTPELLAHVLTVIRRRMKEGGTRRFFPWNRHPATIRSGSER